ncbi:MAG: hypothetical protein JW909_10730 [Planctomycetes bacterium]|nr:hypothetical protein [Planctomycetota bacterium]
MSVVGKQVTRALESARLRFLFSAAVEALLAGVSAGFGVFLILVAAHALGGVSYELRMAGRLLAGLTFAAVAAGVFWARGYRRASLRALAAAAEAHGGDYGGVLVAAVELLGRSPEAADPVTSVLISEAAEAVERKPIRMHYRPSAVLTKLAVAVFLLGPVIPFAAGPRRFTLALVDCMFPARDVLFRSVASINGVDPSGGNVPADKAVQFTVKYKGWPPEQVFLDVSDGSGERTLSMEKETPGVFRGETVFSRGEVTVRARARVPMIEGSREIAGEKYTLTALPVARLTALSHSVKLPFEGIGPYSAGGGDVVAPAGSVVSVTAAADVRLKSLSVEGVVADNATVEGSTAGFSFVVEKTTTYRLQPVPVEGFAGETSVFRVVTASDQPPAVAGALVDAGVKVVVMDDWGIDVVRLKVVGPSGGTWEREIYEGGGRVVRETIATADVATEGSGKYLVQAVASDTAMPEPHVVSGPLLTVEYTAPEEEDPLLASLPPRPNRYLSSPPPEESSDSEASSGAENSPGRGEGNSGGDDRRLESLGEGDASNGGAGGEDRTQDTGEAPRYAGPHAAQGDVDDDEPSGGDTGAQGNPGSGNGETSSLSTPEGGVAGMGEGTDGGGSPDSGDGGGSGRSGGGTGGKPVDGGRPTGNETGPTPVHAETVDNERVESLDVSPEEITGMKLDIPANVGTGQAGEEAARHVDVRFAGASIPAADLERVPASYRMIVRLYWQKVGGNLAASEE